MKNNILLNEKINNDYKLLINKILLKYSKEKNTILDLCSVIKARHALIVKDIYKKVFLVDRDKEMIMNLINNKIKNYKNIFPLYGDMETMNIPEKFDCIMYCWPERPLWKEIIFAIHRYRTNLKSNGIFLFIFKLNKNKFLKDKITN